MVHIVSVISNLLCSSDQQRLTNARYSFLKVFISPVATPLSGDADHCVWIVFCLPQFLSSIVDHKIGD